MFSKLKIISYLILIPFILYNIYLSSFFVLKGEVYLKNDVGRDFLLLQELDQKKIVLIGARANTQGVFHGPLWTYMNYPAFLIGHGDPVTVAWFWLILGIIFLITTFFILRKLFDTSAALLAVALLAVDLVSQTNSIFGQETTFYFMPFFLFTIYMYIQSKKAYFLALHFITVGIFIHLNIGVGILFAMLSIALSSGFIIKTKLWKHFSTLIFLPIVVSNFIIFDVRHGFNITKALLNLGGSSKFLIPVNYWIHNRIDNIISMQIFSSNGSSLSFITFLLIIFFTILEIKNKSKQKNFFLLLIFYYFGYMILSYFNKGIMLFDHIYLLVPLSAIWLSAFVKGSYKIIFIPVILIIIYLNFNYAKGYLAYGQQSFIGKSPDSWISLKTVAKSVIDEQKGKEFGYYVYSPDSYAYQQRYAMIYSFKNANAKAFEYIKKSTTYVIAAPHPIDNPYMNQDWWIKNEARISALPIEKKYFPSGYIVEKFNLTSSEQKVAHDPNIELGLHFR
jgi:hypothetical protein